MFACTWSAPLQVQRISLAASACAVGGATGRTGLGGRDAYDVVRAVPGRGLLLRALPVWEHKWAARRVLAVRMNGVVDCRKEVTLHVAADIADADIASKHFRDGWEDTDG